MNHVEVFIFSFWQTLILFFVVSVLVYTPNNSVYEIPFSCILASKLEKKSFIIIAFYSWKLHTCIQWNMIISAPFFSSNSLYIPTTLCLPTLISCLFFNNNPLNLGSLPIYMYIEPSIPLKKVRVRESYGGWGAGLGAELGTALETELLLFLGISLSRSCQLPITS